MQSVLCNETERKHKLQQRMAQLQAQVRVQSVHCHETKEGQVAAAHGISRSNAWHKLQQRMAQLQAQVSNADSPWS